MTPENAFGFRRRPFFYFLEITFFWAEKPLEFPISATKCLRISAKTFFFIFSKSPVFGLKNRLNFRFRPQNAFGFRRRPFFFRNLSGTKIASFHFRNNENLGQVRLRNNLPKNPGYVPVSH